MKEVNRHEWNRYVASQPHAQFLQSWEWGQFQESLGFPVHRVGVWNTSGVMTECIQFQELPLFGRYRYLYAPRGPVGYFSDSMRAATLNYTVKQFSYPKKTPLFIRYESVCDARKEDGGAEWERRVLPTQPDREWFLDLAKSEEELFSQMHSKTRYNIRLASKKDVQVHSVDLSRPSIDKHIDILVGFLKKTAQEKEYRLHSGTYYRSLINFFTQESHERQTSEIPYIGLYEATVGQEQRASACIMYFGDTAYYLYGGSDARYAPVMAPFALHAFIWNDARKRGYRYYNFGGIAPEGVSGHPLSGITRFKMGFGGEHIAYPGTFDTVLNRPGYMLYTIGRPFWRIVNRARHFW